MHKINKQPNHFSFIILVFVSAVTLAGCQSGTDLEAETIPEVTLESEVLLDSDPTEAPSDETNINGSTQVEKAEINQCLVCHTDQQELTNTAYPVEVVESESSGEG